MKRLSAVVLFGAGIIAAGNAEAAPYFKIDLGWNEIRTKFEGTADSVPLDYKAHRPHGGIAGFGIGSQLGDYRIELMANASRNHRTLHFSPNDIKVRLHRFSAMVNVYYDHYVGIVSPYAMVGWGGVLHKARLKNFSEISNTQIGLMDLRNVRGLIGQGGIGVMIRMTESLSMDVGFRAGHQRFKKSNNTNHFNANNSVQAKYGVFYTMLTGLQVKL